MWWFRNLKCQWFRCEGFWIDHFLLLVFLSITNSTHTFQLSNSFYWCQRCFFSSFFFLFYSSLCLPSEPWGSFFFSFSVAFYFHSSELKNSLEERRKVSLSLSFSPKRTFFGSSSTMSFDFASFFPLWISKVTLCLIKQITFFFSHQLLSVSFFSSLSLCFNPFLHLISFVVSCLLKSKLPFCSFLFVKSKC